MAFGANFSEIWTAESLGIDVPKGNNCSVFYYLINTTLQAVHEFFTSFSPLIEEVNVSLAVGLMSLCSYSY